jgi:hypothetical protein
LLKAEIEQLEDNKSAAIANEFKGIDVSQRSLAIIAERGDKRAVDFITRYDLFDIEYDQKVDALRKELEDLQQSVKSSGPSALQTLSILLYPRALDAISRSAVPDASQLSGITRIGEEFYQMAVNTVLADPSKLSTVYYPKLIKNNTGGTGASVYFELTPYDSEDPGALGSPFYAARVQIAEREKPVTIILVKPNSPFGKNFGTPRFLAEIDLANPSEGKMSSTVPTAPVVPTQPAEPPVAKKARPVLTANTFEEPQAEVTSESPFLDSLQDEEGLRAAAKEVKEACKGDLDDIA